MGEFIVKKCFYENGIAARMASVVEEGIGDPQLKTEIGAVVGNAGAAGAGGELEVPIAVPQRVLRQPVVVSLLGDLRFF